MSITQITATFNLSGALAGTYKVYVTNPDGQKDSTSFMLASSCSVALRSANNNAITKENIDINAFTYPNPARSIVNVTNKNSGKSTIQLMDRNSRILQEVHTSSTNTKLNVSNLSSGLYIIKIITDNKVQVHKFIKE